MITVNQHSYSSIDISLVIVKKQSRSSAFLRLSISILDESISEHDVIFLSRFIHLK